MIYDIGYILNFKKMEKRKLVQTLKSNTLLILIIFVFIPG